MVFSYTGYILGKKILEIIKDQVDREFYPDESQIKERLIELQTMLESGEISEKEYEAEESRLIQRWREIQESKEEYKDGA